METLIWFSMPGAILVATIALLWPSTVSHGPTAALMAVVTPLVGFSLHQLFRVIFELTGGFARPSRRSLDEIVALATLDKLSLSRRQAFLIWEVTFYSNEFPSSFRDHDRGAWHYILSFWSMTLASIFALLVTVFAACLSTQSPWFLQIAIAQVVLGLVFFLKGRQTYLSLLEQETALIHLHKPCFRKSLDAVQKPNP